MKHINLLGLTLFFGLFTYCQQTTNNTQTVAQNWKLLDEKGYSVQYPENWDLDPSGQMGTSFAIFSKKTSEQDPFRENVNLLIQDMKGMGIDLDKYVEISEGQVKTMTNNGKILESKRLSSNGIEFQKMIYTSQQGNYLLKFEQYYWVKQEKAFVLTLTCEAREFDNYRTTGEKILNSFRFKK